jgi:flagellar motor switch protein FliN
MKDNSENLTTTHAAGASDLSHALADMAPQVAARSEGTIPQGSLLKIPVNVQVILGSTRMALSKVMALGPGSVVVLDRQLSEPVVLLVNGNEIARGLIVVVDEKTGQLGVTLTDVSSDSAASAAALPV